MRKESSSLKIHTSVSVSVAQPSSILLYSTYSYILGNKRKKKESDRCLYICAIIFLYYTTYETDINSLIKSIDKNIYFLSLFGEKRRLNFITHQMSTPRFIFFA